MAIKITVSNKVGFKVKGSINNEAGTPEPFEFNLIADRLDTEAIQAVTQSEGTLVDFLASIITDWKNVKDEDGAVVPYSEDALRQLCKIPGVAGVIFSTYFAEAGAKAKN